MNLALDHCEDLFDSLQRNFGSSMESFALRIPYDSRNH